MSDTEWKISGSVGDELPTENFAPQQMTQGLGFPLRPVAGVPPQGTGSQFNPDTVASGVAMQFIRDGWTEGKYYFSGATLTDGSWTMVANKATLSYPYPLPEGNAEDALASWTPVTQSDVSVVRSGHVYTVNEDVVIRAVNVYVPLVDVDTTYRIIAVVSHASGESSTMFDNPVLTVNAWRVVSLANVTIRADSTITIFNEALNSGSNQVVLGGWEFTGQDNTGAPVASAWNHNNAQTVVRISRIDLDGVDRSTELSGMITNTSLQFATTKTPNAFSKYRVTSEPPLEVGGYFEYQVALQEQGEGGAQLGDNSLTALVPITQATQYSEVVGSVPVYTGPDVTAVGFLQFAGVDQGGAGNSYGIDIEFESVTASPDWDVLAYISP